MAITGKDIHEQSFSIDRKGYDVDEVDVFLERVADEIDALNQQIEQLSLEPEQSRFEGIDQPTAVTVAESVSATIAEGHADAQAQADSDERIVELEAEVARLSRELDEKSANDAAISQALIVAQRSADDVVAKAKAEAVGIVKDAEAEAVRIANKAEADRQRVLDAIKALEDDRDDVCADYRDLLTDFMADANRKLAEIDAAQAGSATARPYAPTHAATACAQTAAAPMESAASSADASATTAFPAPAMSEAPYVPAVPQPVVADKDLSGFGDVADDLDFGDPE